MDRVFHQDKGILPIEDAAGVGVHLARCRTETGKRLANVRQGVPHLVDNDGYTVGNENVSQNIFPDLGGKVEKAIEDRRASLLLLDIVQAGRRHSGACRHDG